MQKVYDRGHLKGRSRYCVVAGPDAYQVGATVETTDGPRVVIGLGSIYANPRLPGIVKRNYYVSGPTDAPPLDAPSAATTAAPRSVYAYLQAEVRRVGVATVARACRRILREVADLETAELRAQLRVTVTDVGGKLKYASLRDLDREWLTAQLDLAVAENGVPFAPDSPEHAEHAGAYGVPADELRRVLGLERDEKP